MKCIDVSNWQGVIPVETWKKIKEKNKIPYCMLRSSFTYQAKFKLEKDKSFEGNVKNAHAAGMKIGVYHYSQALTEEEAIKEAEFVIKTLKKYKKYITLPVTIDWEFGGRLNATKAKKLGKVKCLKIISAFCNKVKEEGYTPLVYANLSTLNNYISVKLSEKWKVWVAHYARQCGYKHPKYMWQFTDKAKIAGIAGNLDMNYIYLPKKTTAVKKTK